MTIYRRRASSSPFAIERSLERRRDGLLRVVQRKAHDFDLSSQDVPDAVDHDDLAEGEGTGHVSAALPSDPKVARAELAEVEHVLDLLRALHGHDSKRDCFFDVLRHITEDGRPILVFTEYADTLQYLRDTLMDHYGKSLGCYSGDGGQLWDGGDWKSVTKDVITAALREEKLRVLLCTDAASEGLNLQAAGAVINYDLPWNPSKVEQRIGRVDRIGQRCPTVLVVNLFLKNSVDDRVYRVLRVRCGLFERFVGAMQPVLARARRMLLGQDPADLETLTIAAEQVKRDPVAGETYLESPADAGLNDQVPLSRQQIEAALAYLNGNFGFQVESDSLTGTHVISGPGFSTAALSCKIETLEHDHQVLPLTPFEPRLRELGDRLLRPGERLPLVIGSHQQGAFRRSVTYWVSDDGIVPVETMADLLRRVETWTGTYPDPAEWLRAHDLAQQEAKAQVEALESRAAQREREGLWRQREAASVRLQRELGRYLVCLTGSAVDLNGLLYHHMSRDIASSRRLMQCLEKLGGYLDWDSELCRDLESFAQALSENQRKARLLGKELDAALEDPRWIADLPTP
jgi:hypothetical protein